MPLTHAKVVETLEQRVGKKHLSIAPDNSSSSHPPNGGDTPEYWQIFYDNRLMATLFNENYRGRFYDIANFQPILLPLKELSLPLAEVSTDFPTYFMTLFSTRLKKGYEMQSALGKLTNNSVYSQHRLTIKLLASAAVPLAKL